MRSVVSSPDADGHVLVVDLPDGCVVSVVVDDGDGDGLRRLTVADDERSGLADLVLLGMRVTTTRADGTESAPVEPIAVAEVVVDGPAPQFTYAHPPSSTVLRFDWPQAAALLAAAVGELVTDTVATDLAADDPVADDPGGLTDGPDAG